MDNTTRFSMIHKTHSQVLLLGDTLTLVNGLTFWCNITLWFVQIMS